MLCRQVMEIHFLVMDKSWKIIVEKEWSPCIRVWEEMSTAAKYKAFYWHWIS